MSMAGSVATTNVTTAIAQAGRMLRTHTMDTTISLMEKVKPCLRSSVQARYTAVRGAHKRGLVWSMRSGAGGYSRLAAVWVALFKGLPLVDNMRPRGTPVVAFANSVGVLSATNMMYVLSSNHALRVPRIITMPRCSMYVLLCKKISKLKTRVCTVQTKSTRSVLLQHERFRLNFVFESYREPSNISVQLANEYAQHCQHSRLVKAGCQLLFSS